MASLQKLSFIKRVFQKVGRYYNKEKNKHNIQKFLLLVLAHLTFYSFLYIFANFGEDIHLAWKALEHNRNFIIGVLIADILVSTYLILIENSLDNLVIYFFKFRKSRSSLRITKKLIKDKVEIVETFLDTRERVNAKNYKTNYDNRISEIIKKANYEIENVDVDHDSINNVIEELKSPTIKEIHATSDSPLSIWFTPEMMAYIVMQVKIYFKNNISIKRYILESSENLGIVKKFNPTYKLYDVYGIIKEIHSDAISLFVIEENNIPQSIQDLECKSILVVSLKSGENIVWTFSDQNPKFKYSFNRINDQHEKAKYLNAFNDVKSANNSPII